jgi:purine-binding chemotaxis protein CheW
LTDSSSQSSCLPQPALAVRIGKNLHAIPLDAVVEVLPALPIETVPQCPAFLRGVVFVRGHLIPVVNAAERLGVTDGPPAMEPHIVCLQIGERLVGVEVDEAIDLIHLERGTRLSAREIGAREGFFSAVVDLDGSLFRILDPNQFRVQEEMAAFGHLV